MKRDEDAYQTAISMLLAGSLDLGVRKLELLAKQGDGHADSVLGALYEFGKDDIQQDQHKAMHHYELASASIGSVQAWLGIARICLAEDASLRDYSRAREILMSVAENVEYPQAFLNLGYMYLNGLGGSRDLSAAKNSYQQAVNQGSILGYTGLSKVAFAEGNFFLGMGLRIKAVAKAIKEVVKGNEENDSLKPW